MRSKRIFWLTLAQPLRTLRIAFGWQPVRKPVSQAESILVIRPDEIGDVVLMSAFLRELRRAAPRARITLIVKPACRQIVEHCPYVDAVHTLEFKVGGGKGYRLRLIWAMWRLRWAALRAARFDLVLLPRRAPDSYGAEIVAHGLAGRGAVAVHRDIFPTGLADVTSDPPPASDVYSNPNVEHEVLHNLRFLEWCGAGDIADSRLEVWLTEADRKFGADTVAARGKCTAFATGAGNPIRCWPVDRFGAIAAWLQDSRALTPILFGAPGDPKFEGGIDLIGRTTLRQAAAVIGHCVLFIGNDSGMMHIAAAMGVPVVEISGFRAGGEPNHYNSPTRFYPRVASYRVVQPPAGRESLAIEEVSEDVVRAACSELLVSS